jgi:hypothetical protein
MVAPRYALVFLVALALPAEAAELAPLVGTCIAKLEQQPDVDPQKIQNLAGVCPQFAAELATHPLGQLIEDNTLEDFSVEQLQNLRGLIDGYKSPQPGTAQLDFANLDTLLETILVTQASPKESWWERFKLWLKKHFLPQDSAEDDWLIDFLNAYSLPDWLAEILWRVVMALTVGMGILVVVNELRHAGIRRWLRGKPAGLFGGIKAAGPQHVPALSGWNALAALWGRDKLVALLRLMISALIEAGRLPDNKSCTNREFLQHLRCTDPLRAGVFEKVLLYAEECVYGGRQVENETIDALAQALDRQMFVPAGAQ